MPSTSVTKSEIPGGWAEREIGLGRRVFRVVLPAEPDEFLEHVEEPRDGVAEEVEPYWANLWPSACPLAEAVLDAGWSRQERVLEIGCGIGLVGLAALARGNPVTFSDLVPLAVELAAENARRNGFSRFHTLLLDWREPIDEQYPVILGSDVLYDRENHGPLLDVVQTMLSQDGLCWLGDPGRYHADAFLEQALARGFSVRLTDASGTEIQSTKAGQFQRVELRRGEL